MRADIWKLATFRDPRSHFTFLNYLKIQNRLEAFANLGTFLPLREEFNDYLAWAASHFDDQVRYGAEVESVCPATPIHGLVRSWRVIFRNCSSQTTGIATSRHIVVAVGGTPKLPRSLQSFGLNVIHSSDYASQIPTLLHREKMNVRIAVIGGGQSAVEIFDDLTSKYPEANVSLFIAGSALKPSDDSPL